MSYFQGSKWKSALYRDKAKDLFVDMWKSMGEQRFLRVCRGTVLDDIYLYLINKGIPLDQVQRIEITDPFQSMLEEKFAQSLMKIGVPRKTTGAHCLSFEDALEWVKENPKRVKYVKTGWNSWKVKYSKQMNLK